MSDHNRPSSHSTASGSDPELDCADLTRDISSAGPAAPVSIATPASPPQLNAGRYQMLAEIAHGGMGVIWLATDTTLNREVAVKVLQDNFAPDSGTARRFADEARITAQLQHPAIPPVHDYGKLPDERPFLAMKLIKGRTLEELLRRRSDPAADRGRFVAVFEQVCQAVGYAHAHHVIHRDIKPSNVMVGSFGEVQVMDWGLAKVLTEWAAPTVADTDQLETVGGTHIRGSDPDSSGGSYTQAGSILGTLAYMPPEQAAGEIGKVDRRSDVFGLGAMLTVILTGKPPYAGADSEAVRVMAIRGDLTRCFVGLDACGAEPELVALCKRCLSFAPADRPRDAGVVAEEVAGLRAATEERARAAETARAAAIVKVAELRKRRRWQAAVAGVGVLMLALLGVSAWWLDRKSAEREKDRAVAAERERQEAFAALGHAEDVLEAGDLAAADLSIAQADRRIGPDAPDDLSALLANAKRDRDLVRDLREIEDLSWAPGLASMPDPADIAGRHRAMFARYGLDVAGTDPEVTADLVRASRVAAELIAGLSEWFSADPHGPNLRPLIDRLDPDSGRAAIRAAIQAGDESRVRVLVGALDGSKLPAWFAASIGIHQMVPQEDGVRLMAAALRTHPADYLLAYRSSHPLGGTGEMRMGEMLAWAQVAVALRPDSPFSHNQLGHAWRAMHNWSEAEASARRAIELGRKYPKYAGAQVNLGNVMLDKGDLDGAEASYRAALAIDPGAGATLFNIGLVYDRRGDLVGAADWYRKAATVDPIRPYRQEVLNATIRRLARLDELAAGQSSPASPAEAIAFAELAALAPRRYVLAVKFYRGAFTTDPSLLDGLNNSHRFKAACCALKAAAGKDREMTSFGVEEWGYLTGLALQWLKEDLALQAPLAKNPNLRQEIREKLIHWKSGPEFASVRDPEWLGAMPPDDRKAWEALWRELDGILGSISNGPASAKP